MEEIKKITFELTKEQARDLSIFIEMGMWDALRNDPDVDNIEWVHKWIHEIERLNVLFTNVIDKFTVSTESNLDDIF